MLEISICRVRHIVHLQDKCAGFHVPKLDHKLTINHVSALGEETKPADIALSPKEKESASLFHTKIHGAREPDFEWTKTESFLSSWLTQRQIQLSGNAFSVSTQSED